MQSLAIHSLAIHSYCTCSYLSHIAITVCTQMRARNEYNFSEWSQPVQLQLSSPDVVVASEATTTMMTTMDKNSKGNC